MNNHVDEVIQTKIHAKKGKPVSDKFGRLLQKPFQTWSAAPIVTRVLLRVCFRPSRWGGLLEGYWGIHATVNVGRVFLFSFGAFRLRIYEYSYMFFFAFWGKNFLLRVNWGVFFVPAEAKNVLLRVNWGGCVCLLEQKRFSLRVKRGVFFCLLRRKRSLKSQLRSFFRAFWGKNVFLE